MPTVIYNSNHATGLLQGSGAASPSFSLGVDSYVTLQRSASAGPVLVTKSVDGGATFTPKNPQPVDLAFYYTPPLSPCGLNVPWGEKGIVFVPADPTALYRLEADLGSGAAVYTISPDRPHLGKPIGIVETGESSPNHNVISMTAAQAEVLYDTMFTDPGSLSGDLTLYKRRLNNEVIELLVPAAAQRAKGHEYLLGCPRAIRVEFADVTSITDALGNPLTSASSRLDAKVEAYGPTKTTYTVGQSLMHENKRGMSFGAFTDSTYYAGIYGYPSLIEAVANHMPGVGPAPDLAALGL